MKATYTTVDILRGLYELEPLLEIVREHDLFIAGGAARYMLSPHPKPIPYGDVDVYGFTGDEQATAFAYALQGPMAWRASNDFFYEHQRVTDRKRMAELDSRWWVMPTVQAVHKYVEATPKMQDRMIQILSNFDLTNVRAAVYFDYNRWVWRGFVWAPFYQAELERVVDIEGCAVPVSTIRRLKKYQAAGYTMRTDVPAALLAHMRLLRREQQPQQLYSRLRWEEGENGMAGKLVGRVGYDDEDQPFYYQEMRQLQTLWTSKADLLNGVRDV